MIDVVNDFNTPEDMSLADVEPGEAFLGTVESVDGDEYSGVFVRSAMSVVLLDDPSVEFAEFYASDGNYAPTVKNFRRIDITVRVDSVLD